MSTNYASTAEFTDWAFAGQSPTEPDLVDIALDAASRQIEEYCDREFPGFNADTVATPRVYAVEDPISCWVDDISDTTAVTVKVDRGGDGVYEETWNTTDYQIEPLNANVRGRPGNLIRVSRISGRFFPLAVTSGYVQVANSNTLALVGNQYGSVSVKGAACVQVTAKWGWPAVPSQVKQAALIQAHFLLTNRGSPLGVVLPGFDGTGSTRITSYLHPAAKGLLSSLRLDAGGVV